MDNTDYQVSNKRTKQNRLLSRRRLESRSPPVSFSRNSNQQSGCIGEIRAIRGLTYELMIFFKSSRPTVKNRPSVMMAHQRRSTPALNQKRKGLDTMARILYTTFDYVIRRFNLSSARLNKPQGLDLRWNTALRDLQIQLEPESAEVRPLLQSAS
jgi:hypothetical protein